MVWQELVDHVNMETVKVESKDGNRYPVKVEKRYMAEDIYSQFMNEAHDDKTYWAWVEFEDDGPVLDEWTRGDMPSCPPWMQPC